MDMNQFTQKAREALQAAQRIAVEYSNNTVEQEHLLAALAQQQDGLIPQMLTNMGTDPNAFAQAAVTFTSQNFGAGNLKRCKRIFWLCMLFGMGFTEILSIIFMIWDEFFVGIYTVSSSVAVYGLVRMHHVCSLEGLTATYEVESAALRGMGKSLEPSIITILGTVVFRMIWLLTVFKWFPTYDMLMNVYVASWVCTGGAIFVVWFLYMRKMEKRQAELT